MALQQRGLVDMYVRTDKKYQLTRQVSDGSLGSPKTTRGLPLTGECDITHPAAQARSLPTVTMGQGVEADVEEKHTKRYTTYSVVFDFSLMRPLHSVPSVTSPSAPDRVLPGLPLFTTSPSPTFIHSLPTTVALHYPTSVIRAHHPVLSVF